jgi:hypothetical protein
MTLSKASVQPIDLDDLERQLREVAVSSLPKRSDDPLAELARIVGRDKSLRSIVGGRAQASQPALLQAGANDSAGVKPQLDKSQLGERSAAAPSAQAELDLESSIKEAFRTDQPHDATADGPEMAYDEDGAAAEDEPPQYAEEWEEQQAEEDVAYADEGGSSRFDAVEQVPRIPELAVARGASTGRGFMSPRIFALTVPLVLLAMVGVGAAVVMRAGPTSRSVGNAPVIKADETPVKVQPAKAAGSDQTPSQAALDAADPSGKPSQVVVQRPEQPVDVVAAAKGAQPRGAASGQPPSSAGIVIVSGPGTAGGPASPPPPAAAPSKGAAPAAAAASPAAIPAALPMPTAAANVPLPEPPQPVGQSSVFGTPHRVSTVSVKPDGTIVGNGKPRADASPPPKPAALAMADPGANAVPASTGSITPSPKKPADTVRAKPSPAVVADDQQAAKAAKPAAKPARAKVADAAPADHVAARASDEGAPLSITPQGRRGRTVVASATPAPNASPRAGAAEAPLNVSRGDSSFSIQLASSPSESDARATLSRLQRQFPAALGGGSVRRADLGGKGIFYRVRVGPLSREAADKICSQVKAGGADCILTRG